MLNVAGPAHTAVVLHKTQLQAHHTPCNYTSFSLHFFSSHQKLDPQRTDINKIKQNLFSKHVLTQHYFRILGVYHLVKVRVVLICQLQ